MEESGDFGMAFHGVIRDQQVAIRKVEVKLNLEIIVEIKRLCKLHHTSLVDLIGYSTDGNALFLVYEHSQNGPLANHLHTFTKNDFDPLTWNTRVQIALDVARGLDYIHEHMKSHQVHCEVNTSSILLDESYRAKV